MHINYCAFKTAPFFWAITIVTCTFSGKRIGALYKIKLFQLNDLFTI